MSESTYWGSWKGRVVKAIAVDQAQTWSDLQAATGLSEQSLNTAISELYNAGVLERFHGRYRLSSNIYQEYRDYFAQEIDYQQRFDDRTQSNIPDKLGVICPYCEERKLISVSDTIPFEVQCPSPKGNRWNCDQQWHSGVFKVDIIEIGQYQRQRTGHFTTSRSGVYNLRPVDDDRVIKFKSNSSVMMQNDDLVVLTYRRASKGLFTKEWTGEWETSPHIFQNITINHHWKLKR